MAATIRIELQDATADGWKSLTRAIDAASRSVQRFADYATDVLEMRDAMQGVQRTTIGMARQLQQATDPLAQLALLIGAVVDAADDQSQLDRLAGAIEQIAVSTHSLTVETSLVVALQVAFEETGKAAEGLGKQLEHSDKLLSSVAKFLNGTGITGEFDKQLEHFADTIERMAAVSPQAALKIGALELAQFALAKAVALSVHGFEMLLEEGDEAAEGLVSAYERLEHSADAWALRLVKSDGGQGFIKGLTEAVGNLDEMLREGWPTLKGSIALMLGFDDAARQAKQEIEELRKIEAEHHEKVADKAVNKLEKSSNLRAGTDRQLSNVEHAQTKTDLESRKKDFLAQYRQAVVDHESGTGEDAEERMAEWRAAAEAAMARQNTIEQENLNVKQDLLRFDRDIARQEEDFANQRKKHSIEEYAAIIARKQAEMQTLADNNRLMPQDKADRMRELDQLKAGRGTALQDKRTFDDQKSFEYIEKESRLAEQGSAHERQIQRFQADENIRVAREEYTRLKEIIDDGEKKTLRAKETARQDDLKNLRDYHDKVNAIEKTLRDERMARAKDEEERNKLDHEYRMDVAQREAEFLAALDASHRARTREQSENAKELAGKISKADDGGPSMMEKMKSGFTEKDIRKQAALEKAKSKAGDQWETMSPVEKAKAQTTALQDVNQSWNMTDKGVRMEGRKRGKQALDDLAAQHAQELNGHEGDDRKEVQKRQRAERKGLMGQVRGGGFDQLVRGERDAERQQTLGNLTVDTADKAAAQLGVNSAAGRGLQQAARNDAQQAQLIQQQQQQLEMIAQQLEQQGQILDALGGGARRRSVERQGKQ